MNVIETFSQSLPSVPPGLLAYRVVAEGVQVEPEASREQHRVLSWRVNNGQDGWMAEEGGGGVDGGGAPQRLERWDRVPSQIETLAAILADDEHTFVAN